MLKVPPDALVVEPEQTWQRSNENVDAIARRKRGVSVRQLAAALGVDPQFVDSRFVIRVFDLRSFLGAKARGLAFWAVLTGMLFFSLSVFSACGLIGIRASARQHRLFIERALGAPDGALRSGVMLEALTSAALALGAAIVVTEAVLQCARSLVPHDFLELGDLGLDWMSVGVLALSAALGAIVAYLPYFHLLRCTASDLRGGEPRSVGRLRRVMTASQGVLAMLFVGVASMLLRSQIVMFTQDLGLSLESTVVSVSYPDDARKEVVESGIRHTLERLDALPGVRAAAAAQGVMFDDWSIDTVVRKPGAKRPVLVRVKYVRGSYVRATGGRLLAGREPDRGGVDGTADVLVNRALASTLWPGAEAVGESIVVAGRSAPSVVAGVLADAFEAALDEEPFPTIYLYSTTNIPARVPVHYLLDGPPLSERSVTDVVSKTGGGAAVVGVSQVRDRLSETVRVKSFSVLLSAVVAAAALVMAWVGVVVVVGHTITTRTRELAIRLALGAPARRLQVMVTKDVVGCAAVGIAIGAAGAAVMLRIGRSFVYQMGGAAWGFEIAVAVLVLTSVAAISALKGRRASAVEPVRLLRAE